MSFHATGTFEVHITPQEADTNVQDTGLARMSLDKQFHGDLEANSNGVMLSVATAVPDSAAYVALEWVTGLLKGKRGSFALKHNATMHRGTPELQIVVVPDSGTDELAGLAGALAINVVDGRHTYDFEYTLGDAA